VPSRLSDVGPGSLQHLVFRFSPKNLPRSRSPSDSEINDLNEKLLEAVNETGRVFLSHTKLRGKFGIRLAIGNLKTNWEDVSAAWDVVQQKAEELIRP